MAASEITFRMLDGGITGGEPQWPLEIWYARVRDIPISEFSIFDLARSCRQKLYLEHIVPVALSRLAEDPCAGELYDGELALAFQSIPGSYWDQHRDEMKTYLDLALVAFEGVEPEEPKLLVSEQDLLNTPE